MTSLYNLSLKYLDKSELTPFCISQKYVTLIVATLANYIMICGQDYEDGCLEIKIIMPNFVYGRLIQDICCTLVVHGKCGCEKDLANATLYLVNGGMVTLKKRKKPAYRGPLVGDGFHTLS